MKELLDETLGIRILTDHTGGRSFTRFHFRDDDRYIVFDPVSHAATILTPETDLLALYAGWIERPRAFVDDPYAVDLIRSIEYYATAACNLTCSYCYLGKLPTQITPQDQNPKSAIDAISRYFSEDRIGQKLDFLLVGGEPLLARSGIETIVGEITDLASRHNVDLSLRVTTNGTLLDKRYLQWLSQHKFKVTVSLDGLFQEQNRPARFASSRAVTPMDMVHCLGPDNVVFKATLVSSQLGLQAKAFESMRGYGTTNIYVAASYGGRQVSDQEIAENIKGIVQLASYCDEVGLTEGYLSKAMNAMQRGTLASSHCSAGLGHIVLDSSGRKSGCANIRETGQFESMCSSPYHVDHDPLCGLCSFRYVCCAVGGGCRAWRVLRNSMTPDPLECSASATRFVLALQRLGFSHNDQQGERKRCQDPSCGFVF